MNYSRLAASASRSAALAARYQLRQGVARTGSGYEPAIKAVRGEAPSMSRCSKIMSREVGRAIHVMSRTEAAAAMVALHCPSLVDFLEQRCLPVSPERHPASLYDNCGQNDLPWLPGTASMAERLGLVKVHPKFLAEDANGRFYVPLQLVGDLLLILRDRIGVYAVNWTVKLNDDGFRERLGKKPLKRGNRRNAELAEARHRIEEACYREAGIPTYRVTGTTFDRMLVANLRQLQPWDSRDVELDPRHREAMITSLREIVDSDRTPLDLMERLCKQFRCDRRDFLAIFYQSVWRRELVVDLSRPLLVDRPLRSEKVSPFEKYSYLFARGVQ